MVICSLSALKKSSKKKETRIKQEIVEVLQQASYRRKKDKELKDQDDEIFGFNLIFVG